MALTLSQKSSTLAAYLAANRQSTRPGSGTGEGKETTGVQRLGLVSNQASPVVVYTLYYDPAADVIFYDTGNPAISQE